MPNQLTDPDSEHETDGISLDDLGGEDFDDYFDEDEQQIVQPNASSAPSAMRPMPNQGRSRTSPLFQHAEQFPQANQFRVYHMNEGQPHSVGVISIDANEHEFIGKFRTACPGKFILRPVDEMGNYLGNEFTHTVSPHHPMLNAGTPVESVAQTGTHDVLVELMREREALIADKERRLEAELRRREAMFERERIAMQQQREEVAVERVAMASQASSTTASISERQLEAVSNQHRETFAAMGELFQNTNSMMQQVIQWQAQNHQQSMERAKADQQHALDRERQAQEREHQRQHQRTKEASLVAEQARENDRAHFRALTELQQSNSSLGGAKKLLSEFGIKPVDLFQALKGGEGDSGTGPAIISVLGDVAKSFAAASGEAAKAQAQAQTQQIALAAQMQQGGELERQEQQFIDVDYDAEDEFEDEFHTPQAPPQVGSSQEVLSAFRDQTSEAQSQIPLSVQKNARMGVRRLVQALGSAPSTEWQQHIVSAVMENRDILEYVKVVTIRAALVEGGAQNGLENQIITAIDNSGLVPADIPRG